MGERGLNKISPFISGGIFVGHIKSASLGISETKWVVPSGDVGFEYRFHRYVTLIGRYRINGQMAGINTDGFSVGLKFF